MTELEAAGWKKAEEKTADQVGGRSCLYFSYSNVLLIRMVGDGCGHQVHIQPGGH